MPWRLDGPGKEVVAQQAAMTVNRQELWKKNLRLGSGWTSEL